MNAFNPGGAGGRHHHHHHHHHNQSQGMDQDAQPFGGASGLMGLLSGGLAPGLAGAASLLGGSPAMGFGGLSCCDSPELLADQVLGGMQL